MFLDCFVPRNDVKSMRHCEERSNPKIKNITSCFFVPKQQKSDRTQNEFNHLKSQIAT
jgi:hypothetical protein